MSPDKSAIAEKICSVLKKLGLSEELVSLVEAEIMNGGEEKEDEEEMTEEMPVKKAAVVVVKKNSMTDMLKGF